jgi:predicted anti-sigma-YlaC factor YlaD
MHRLTKQRLEEILSAPHLRRPAELEQHLAGCPECREELQRFQEHARCLQALRLTEQAQPRPGFFARVTDRIEAQQRASVWSVFLEPAFARRLVVATLALTLVLGSLVAFQVADDAFGAPQPEAIMAVEDHPPSLGQDPERDRQTILVTLAGYREE